MSSAQQVVLLYKLNGICITLTHLLWALVVMNQMSFLQQEIAGTSSESSGLLERLTGCAGCKSASLLYFYFYFCFSCRKNKTSCSKSATTARLSCWWHPRPRRQWESRVETAVAVVALQSAGLRRRGVNTPSVAKPAQSHGTAARSSEHAVSRATARRASQGVLYLTL